jgi:hypothetical protein
MRRVSHHSTTPDRKPERPALSVGGSPEEAVSSCLQGARIGRLPALSRRPGKSALMRPKASAIQVDRARYCTPINVPNRALVRDGKRRVNPGDVVHSSGPPSMLSSPGTGLLPSSESMIASGTRRHGPVSPGASHVECSGEAQFEQGLRELGRYAGGPDQSPLGRWMCGGYELRKGALLLPFRTHPN